MRRYSTNVVYSYVLFNCKILLQTKISFQSFYYMYNNIIAFGNFIGNNFIYTQVVDNRRIIKGFFWSIMDHYSQDCSLDDDNIQ